MIPFKHWMMQRIALLLFFLTEHEIITGSVDGTIRNYDIRVGMLRTDHISQPVTSVSVSGDNNCILASSLDDRIRLLDKENGELLSEYKSHVNNRFKIDSQLTFDDAFVVSGSEDNVVYIWDLVEGKLIRSLRGHESFVVSIDCHPKENLILSGSADGSIRFWR